MYGAEDPQDDEWREFADILDVAEARLAAMAPGKPVAVLEMGVSAANPLGDPAVWASSALSTLRGGRWPTVVGFSWWNEMCQNDSNPAHDTDMRVQSVAGLAAAIAAEVNSPDLLGAPLVPP